jgi:hypothetical protein
MKKENLKMNNCDQIQLLVDDYLDGMIPAPDKLKMEEHLHSCTACRKYIEETVLLIEKAVLLSKDDKLKSEKKTELWNKIDAKVNPPVTSGDSHIYTMSGQEDKETPTKPSSWASVRYYASGMAAVLLLAFVVYGVNQFLKRGDDTVSQVNIVEFGGPKWMVTSLKGNPMMNNLVMKAIDSLSVGSYITTDDSSKAELYVAGLGSVIIEANSRVKLVKSTEGEHRIALEYGSIDANIIATPRTFFVDAGTVTAVDLGCSYKFSVDRSGDGLLYVRQGRVALESSSGRESIVPEGKFCVTKKDIGPGTPFREDTSPVLKKALMEFDFGNCGAQCVNVILKNAKKTDAVTLVNIIPRVENEYKTMVYEKVADFCPPPKNIPTDSIPRLKKLENLNEWVDKIMEEVHKNIEENMEKVEKQVEEQMKMFEDEKWKQQWKNWDKNWDRNVKKNWKFYNGKDTLLLDDGRYGPSPEEMEELQRDLQEMHNDLQMDNEQFKREMEQVKRELERVNDQIKREMEEAQRELEREKRQIEREQEKIQRDMEKDNMDREKEREKERMERQKEREKEMKEREKELKEKQKE